MTARDELIFSAVYGMDQKPKAEAMVDRALSAVYRARTGSGTTRVDTLWRERAERVHIVFLVEGRKDMIVAAVAQWISAKIWTRPTKMARKAAERVGRLADEVTELQRVLADAAAALRYESTTEEGHEATGCAYVVESSLRQALPAIHMAQDAARQMHALAPKDARGCDGIVGTLRQNTPDNILAVALVDISQRYGLSDNGGRRGDGLDVFLADIMGEGTAKKVLTEARNYGAISTFAP